ncbi:MAG: nucleoside triphosphate pyrophosphatase [Vicinamibacterales bacterium]
MDLLLASASPRRAELLTAAGFAFRARATDVDERVRPGELPLAYVQRLASEKSAAAHDPNAPDRVTLGADTAVVVDGVILGKPIDDRDAEAMLRRLSGRTHDVLTGISLRCGVREVVRVERTAVEFAALSNQDVSWYVQSGEGRDKAGGYAIQGLASRFIPRISGSYSNVVGLPIAAVSELIGELAGSR